MGVINSWVSLQVHLRMLQNVAVLMALRDSKWGAGDSIDVSHSGFGSVL